MIKVETQVRGNSLAFETGVMARQADGSTVLKYGDTMLLATAVSLKDAREGIDFFPLTIDYLEKTYAAGKIPGGFFKREGRLSEKETLTSRLIDRPIRPLFPKGFKCETQGIVNVLSFGPENVSDVLGIIGISASLMISDIPFDGPVSAVRIGKKDGEFIVFPNLEEIEELDLQIVVAGTDDAVAMVEGMASEASEEDFLEAIDLAHAEIKKLNALQREFREKAGKPKREFAVPELDHAIVDKVTPVITEKLMAVIKIKDKLERQDAVDAVRKDSLKHFESEDENISSEVNEIFFKLEKKLFRDMVINENVRADGRKPDEIRQITCQVGLLPRAHGSALFTRGETQALAVATLGTRDDEQRIDALEGDHFRKFMLHYNFPPFSVGEARFLRGPGRREIGHGSLAYKAITPMLPSIEEWPYTMRVVSEVLESNGSSSMATVCGTTLSLMDAGVPIKAPVAGIAMGLIKEGDKAVILSDIMGLEDHLGDLDFKVTGTRTGITAFQMDSKLGGIDRELMSKALEQAKNGRLHILDKMHETIETPRDGLSPHAPRIFTLTIKQDKIRDIIGPGGKIIKQIIEDTGTKINVEDSGLVSIASSDEESAQRAIDIIRGITADPELDRIYKGKVVRITDFGAFVEILPGTDGLLHISQIDNKRVEKVTDVLSEGDEVDVKVIEIDKLGRVRLSRKDALKELAEKQ
ncbi:polyribonucleotide nucleotidyltransferase [Nitrospirota bacterium]